MSLANQPAKSIYLANRHPRLTREEFQSRWCYHSRMGEIMGDPRLLANISSLRYCLTVDPSGILDCATNEHDGVSLLALRSLVSIPSYYAMLTDNDIAYADELRTFERPVEDFSLYMASELLLEGAETDVVVFELARRQADVHIFDYLRHADSERDRQLEQTGLVRLGLSRWVRNVAVAPGPRGFGYDVVNELWFPSIEKVATASQAIDQLFGEGAKSDRPNSTILVTNVILRIGRDRP